MRKTRGKIAALLLAIAVAHGALGGAASAADLPPWQQPVATTIEQSRNAGDPAANDFIRLIFVPPSVSVGSLGLTQPRVFMAATSFFRAPSVSRTHTLLSLSAVARSTGGAYSATNDVAAMRCKLPDPAHSAVIASWPNVFAAIVTDLAGPQCHPMPPNASAENQVFCLAQSYRDRADLLTVKPLAAALDTGLAMMEVTDSSGHTGAEVLGHTYGIGSGFSGLGYAVAGSLNTSLRAAQSLRQSIVTEYLVKKSTLKAAGCHCIQVPAYAGRDAAPLDPDYIVEKGTLGANGLCVRVGRLGLASSRAPR